jgi:hypothetical protein
MLQPLPGRVRLLWLFGWPLLMAWSLGLAALWMADRPEPNFIALVVLVVVSIVVVGPINSGWHTFVLMKGLPQRLRSAPFLIFVPRTIAIPMLVAATTIIIFTLATVAASVLVLAFGRFGR